MSAIEPLAAPARDLRQVGDWRPARYTPSLTDSETFPTHADRLIPLIERAWSVAEAETFTLDPWQVWLLRHMLEHYPDDWPVEHLRGRLRYKQIVVSLARQNGKSLVAALVVFWLLGMHVRGARVAGFASIESQSRIVYDRVRYAIDNHPELKAVFKTTVTRGITRNGAPGLYRTYPAKEESVQGEPFTGVLYDELHIGQQAVWDAAVVGQRANENALIVGITTAGDDESHLLANLYAHGARALEGHDERFGFFVWEAATDELTEAGVIAANPAVACGRIPLASVMAEARRMWANPASRAKVIRYTLNRFVQGTDDAWLPPGAFARRGDPTADLPAGQIVYALDRTPDWSALSVWAGVKHDGQMVGHYLARIPEVDHSTVVAVATALLAHRPGTLTMPSDMLRAVGRELKDAGHHVYLLGQTEMMTAAETTAATITRSRFTHDGHAISDRQAAYAARRMVGASWRLSRTLSPGPIDAVTSLAALIFVLEIQSEHVFQLF